MKKQMSWFYLCLIALAWLGLHLGNATELAAVSAAPAAVAANEGCSAGIGNITIQRTSGGNNFVVSWEHFRPITHIVALPMINDRLKPGCEARFAVAVVVRL